MVSAYLIKSIYLFFSWWKSNFILKINNEISGKLLKNIFTVPILIFLIKILQSSFEIFIQKVDILTKQ